LWHGRGGLFKALYFRRCAMGVVIYLKHYAFAVTPWRGNLLKALRSCSCASGASQFLKALRFDDRSMQARFYEVIAFR
jgi:hypothetical protein